MVLSLVLNVVDTSMAAQTQADCKTCVLWSLTWLHMGCWSIRSMTCTLWSILIARFEMARYGPVDTNAEFQKAARRKATGLNICMSCSLVSP